MWREVDLDALLASITADCADAGKPVTLSVECGMPILTKRRALRRMLCNLIDNAQKFAGQADIELRRNPDGGVEIAVLDRGPGIPAAELEAVFQPFYRLETSRKRDAGGTGLGWQSRANSHRRWAPRRRWLREKAVAWKPGLGSTKPVEKPARGDLPRAPAFTPSA